MGHFPLFAAGYEWPLVKRQASALTTGWDEEILDASMLTDIIARIREADPVGDWCVSGHEMNVWVDVSVILEVNGNIIDDASWLCPTADAKHVNLALQW